MNFIIISLQELTRTKFSGILTNKYSFLHVVSPVSIAVINIMTNKVIFLFKLYLACVIIYLFPYLFIYSTNHGNVLEN